MKCEDVRKYASPYLDSELDPTTSFEIARHLEQCGECMERFENESRLERAMARDLRNPEAGDEELFGRALERAQRRSVRKKRWIIAASAAAVLVAAGVLAIVLQNGGLAGAVRQDFKKYAAAHASLEVNSSDPQVVKAFFEERMGLSVRAPVPAGWELVGGRKCMLKGIPTAFLLYKNGEASVILYLFSADHLERFPGTGDLSQPVMDESGEANVAVARAGPNVVCAAGKVPCKSLLEICGAFRSATDRWP